MKADFQKIRRFGIAGGFATLISYFSFPLIYETLFDHKLFEVSYLFASFINVTASYVMQRKFVFKSNKYWLPEYIYFWTNAGLLSIVSFVILYGLIYWLHINLFLSNFIVVTLSAIASYILHKNVTFNKSIEHSNRNQRSTKN
jgi:putative flippase GtrA